MLIVTLSYFLVKFARLIFQSLVGGKFTSQEFVHFNDSAYIL